MSLLLSSDITDGKFHRTKLHYGTDEYYADGTVLQQAKYAISHFFLAVQRHLIYRNSLLDVF
jgi:hypothetical protein